MKSLELEDMKLILKTEVKKSIDHSHHVHLGTNEFDESSKFDSLKTITKREEKFRRVVIDDLIGYEKELDSKLEGILKSLDIEFKPSSLPYKQLRRSFVKLYSLRFDWIKDLINESGRTDDDFRRDADEKLKMELFPELQSPPSVQVQVGDQILNPVIENLAPEPPQPYRVQEPVQLSGLQSTPVSECIGLFLSEKGDVREMTIKECKTALNFIIEEFGDIPIGRLDREKGTLIRSHIRKLPKNRTKIPKYRDKDLHELIKMKIPSEDLIHPTTINKHLGHLSSFMSGCLTLGYSDINPFKGTKLKKNTIAKDERDPFTEKEIKEIFSKENYLFYTNVENGGFGLPYYWVPLIGLFSGLRANEICSLYLDNVKTFDGNGRRKVWCFNILEESERPEKRLKNKSSRRIVPIHDTLVELGFLDYLKLLKSSYPERKRVFEELPFRNGSYARNVSRFFNDRYLPKLGIKKSSNGFHSLRHSIIDHLKQKGVEIHYINEMMGHTSGNIDLDRYGKGYNPDIIYNKCVKKVQFETSHARGIDFNPLKLNWKKIIQ
uniref:Tyr recombinase domain-containing protein n=1 Tax=uncultured bacterium EIL80B09 TaxID=1768206 RepID=A0A0U2N627_9BACT|nr:hypothetical protein [uncultured bacterium EIL80B09]